jgi:flagellar hook-associated protein 2
MAGGLFEATSPTNTFDDLLPNVDVTVKAKTTDPVTVTVTTDSDALANKVQSLVNAVNGVVTSAKSLTAYNATTKTGALLNGDRTAQRLAQELTRAFIDPVSGNSTLPSKLGITLGKDGTFTFDKVKFQEALADNPNAAQGLFVQAGGAPDNVTTRLAAVAKAATETGTGYLRTAEESQRARVTAFTDQIETIERRLEKSSANLRRQFSAMESALSNMKSQSNWLSGQIAGLYSSSG